MAVGVFGGTFDPVHLGHLVLAETAADELKLDRVVFLPAGNPYLKVGTPVSPAKHRMAMVKAAIKPNPRFEVSAIEVEDPGPSYTIHSLDRLRAAYPKDEFPYLLLGVDSVLEMPRWKRPEEIFERAQVVAYPRAGLMDAGDQDSIRILGRRVRLLGGPLVGVSGTEIRSRVSSGRSIKFLVPDSVAEYIQCNGLYSAASPGPIV